MSSSLIQHTPFRGISPTMNYQQCPSSPFISPPQSPLDFIDRIPLEEVKISRRTLGSGSFGTVFKGRWRNKNVAIKQYKTSQERDSFLVEVKQLSCVKHANIVKLYGAITSTDTAYLIMEYAEGGSLNNLLHECKTQKYDLRHACSWARQAARGVAYLHGIRPKPIMHRDLKPANLLLFERGKVLKICDFGTACDVKTQMTNNTGSPSYMAPEVFSTSSYHESGDVFSWGIIFWEILARLHPYQQQFSNPFQILWSVNQGTRPATIDNCPRHIRNLITSSWNGTPEMRPSMAFIAEEMNCIFKLVDKRYQRQTPDGADTMYHRQDNVSRTTVDDWTPTMSPIDLPHSSSPQPQTSNYEHTSQNYSSIHSLQMKAKRTEALKHRIDTLQKNAQRLEELMICDQMNRNVSFDEFEKLKGRLVSIRRQMSTVRQKSSGPNISAS